MILPPWCVVQVYWVLKRGIAAAVRPSKSFTASGIGAWMLLDGGRCLDKDPHVVWLGNYFAGLGSSTARHRMLRQIPGFHKITHHVLEPGKPLCAPVADSEYSRFW